MKKKAEKNAEVTPTVVEIHEIVKAVIGDLCMIPVEIIALDPNQPRETYDGIEGLAASMGAKGFDQTFAITVRPHPEKADEFMVVVGHRRLQAAKMVGIEEIPCHIKTSLSDSDVYELQLMENENRRDLSIMNRVRAIQKGLDRGLGERRMANILGISMTTLKSDLELTGLAKDLHKVVDDGKLSKELAKELVKKFPGDTQQVHTWNNVLREKKTVEAMKQALQAYVNKNAQVDLFADARKKAAETGGLIKIRKATVQIQKQVIEFEKKNYHTDPNVVSARKDDLPTLKQLVASMKRIAEGIDNHIKAYEAQKEINAPKRATAA